MAHARQKVARTKETPTRQREDGRADWVVACESGASIAVRAQPGASRDAVEGVVDGRLRLRVQAPPVEGAANVAVRKLLAKALGVSRSKVRIVRGEKSREKSVEVAGADPEQVRRDLTQGK
jgi:uncharacterized protein (TIGR00251 family)